MREKGVNADLKGDQQEMKASGILRQPQTIWDHSRRMNNLSFLETYPYMELEKRK